MGNARGFSGASVEHAAGFSGGVGLWVGVVRSLLLRVQRTALDYVCRKHTNYGDVGCRPKNAYASPR